MDFGGGFAVGMAAGIGSGRGVSNPRALKLLRAPFAIDANARDRWMELMAGAIDECDVPDDVASWMREFLGGVATFLVNRVD